MIESKYSHDFDRIYGNLDVNGKVVVDIGANNGDTASYFLERGASKVICFESGYENQRAIKSSLAQEIKDGRVQVFGAFAGIWASNTNLIQGDVLKVDCEGCERFLKPAFLSTFPQWTVGLHPAYLPHSDYARLIDMLEAMGGVMIDNGTEQVFLKK